MSELYKYLFYDIVLVALTCQKRDEWCALAILPSAALVCAALVGASPFCHDFIFTVCKADDRFS